MTVIDKLQQALETAKERGETYRHDGHELTGAALAILIPEGITLKTAEDYTRFQLFINVAIKFSRYCVNYNKGGHKDSIHDLGIYAFNLEDYDDKLKEKQNERRLPFDNRV